MVLVRGVDETEPQIAIHSARTRAGRQDLTDMWCVGVVLLLCGLTLISRHESLNVL